MTTAKDFLYQQFMDDPDIIPPEGKTKEELVEELVDQKLRQSRNNSRAFELLSKDAGGGYDIATYSWDKSTKKVQEPWVDEKELEKAVPDKYGEPTKGQLKLLHRPFKVLTGSLDDFELEPPPENDSETTQRELKFVRTAAKFAEENPERFEGIDVEDRNLLTPFLDFLASENLSVDEEYLKNVLSDVATIAMYWKFKYNRPRPYQYKGMTERKNESADTPSYPSGHSLQAKVAADILSNAYPEHAEELQYIGKNIGRNRIMGGWHFPSDHAAGRDLADQIIEKLPKNVDMFLKKSPLGEDDYMAAIRSSMQKHAEDFNIPVQKNQEDEDRKIEDERNAREEAQRQANVEANAERSSVKEQKKYIYIEFGKKLFPNASQALREDIKSEANTIITGDVADNNFDFINLLTNIHHRKEWSKVTPEEKQKTYDFISSIPDVSGQGFNVKNLKRDILGFITPSKRSKSSTQSTKPETPEPEAASESKPPASEVDSGSVRTAAQREAERAADLATAPKATPPRADAAGTAANNAQSESANQEASSSGASTSDPDEPKADQPDVSQEPKAAAETTPRQETAKKPATKKPDPVQSESAEEPKAQAETSEESTETAGTTPPSFRQRRLDAAIKEHGDDVLSHLINVDHPWYETPEAVRNTLLSEEKHTHDSFAKKLAEAKKLQAAAKDKAAAEAKAAEEAKAPSLGYKASGATKRELERRLRHDSIRDVVDQHINDHKTIHGDDKKYDNISNFARHLLDKVDEKERMKTMEGFHKQAKALKEKKAKEEKQEELRQAKENEKQAAEEKEKAFYKELEALPEVTRNSTQHDMEEALRAAEVFENKHKDTLSDPKNSKLKTSFDKHKNAQKKNIERWASPKVAAETEETIKSEREEHGADFGGAAHRSKIEDAKTASEAKHVEHQTFLNTVGNQRMKHSVFANRDDHQQTSTFTANDQTEIDEARSKGKTDAEIKQDRISRGLPPGSPPRPGLEWHKETHRWINPDVYKDVGNVLKAGESVHIADPAAIGLAHHVDTTPDGGILAHKDENGNLNIYSPSAAKTNKFGHHAPDHENQPHLPSEEQHARSNAAAHLVSSGKVSMSSAELTEKLGVARATSALETWYREGQGQLYGKYLRGAIGGAAVGALAGPAGAVVGAALGGGLAYAGIKNRKDFTRDAIADKMISELGSKATDATLTAVDQFRAGSVGAPNPLKGSVGKLTSFVRNRGSSDGED